MLSAGVSPDGSALKWHWKEKERWKAIEVYGIARHRSGECAHSAHGCLSAAPAPAIQGDFSHVSKP